MFLGTPLSHEAEISQFLQNITRKGRNTFATPLCTPHFPWKLSKNKWIFAAFGYFSVRNLAHNILEFSSCPKTRLCKGTCKFFKGLIQQLWRVWCVGVLQSQCSQRDHNTSPNFFCTSQICATTHTYCLCISHGEHTLTLIL